MRTGLGIALIVVAAAIGAVTAIVLRTRLPAIVVDALVGACGAAAGVGGLLLLRDVGIAAWILTPAFLAAVAVAHVRALFAGSGPLRT